MKNRTILITGASRGIGRAMALRFAREGANVAILGKTVTPHPKLPGTIHSVAEEVERVGGKAIAVATDVRQEDQVQAAIAETVKRFGGLDAVINNAGAINLTDVEHTPLKRFDLMMAVNARAVLAVTQAALPYLRASRRAHVVNLCPPLNLRPAWLGAFAPYALSKYGMTLLSLGMAEEFRAYRIGVNCLWPKTIIATAAIEFALGSADLLKSGRTPEIMADAAHAILDSDPGQLSGHCYIDEELLRTRGVTDFGCYAFDRTHTGPLHLDLFLDEKEPGFVSLHPAAKNS